MIDVILKALYFQNNDDHNLPFGGAAKGFFGCKNMFWTINTVAFFRRNRGDFEKNNEIQGYIALSSR